MRERIASNVFAVGNTRQYKGQEKKKNASREKKSERSEYLIQVKLLDVVWTCP